MRSGAGHLGPSLTSVVSLLALLGFGAKAGVVPVHVWLPSAHPEAPSHVSALMSGAMVKLGIYGVVSLTGTAIALLQVVRRSPLRRSSSA